VASDKVLWGEIVTAMDSSFDPAKDGHPKKYYGKREVIWYNDFKVGSAKLPATYIQPGGPGWKLY